MYISFNVLGCNILWGIKSVDFDDGKCSVARRGLHEFDIIYFYSVFCLCCGCLLTMDCFLCVVVILVVVFVVFHVHAVVNDDSFN